MEIFNPLPPPITAGLNVDLDPFFELAELMMEMSQGTYGLLKTNN